ncbi:MAG: triose-phosphate isomerase [Gammaproteobacteria bacterium]|nr:triose-phosphate isomerase [Gammaproteobacteria bacterium]
MNNMYIVANWKMNGDQIFNSHLITTIEKNSVINDASHMIICPSMPYLQQINTQKPSYMILGAQNISQYDTGAYTGEVSGKMLADLKTKYVIIGHSERRELYNEDNNVIRGKFSKAIENNIKPILCVGETIEHRNNGETFDYIHSQIDAVISSNKLDNLKELIIAYEPIWAIGTGQTATPESAEEVHSYIRNTLLNTDSNLAENTPILYGGSVNSDNAEKLFKMENINGALIGGASLNGEEFSKIYNIAGELTNE